MLQELAEERRGRRRDAVAKMAAELLGRAVDAAAQLHHSVTRQPHNPLSGPVPLLEAFPQRAQPSQPEPANPAPVSWALSEGMARQFDKQVETLRADVLEPGDHRAARVRKMRIATRRLRALLELTGQSLPEKSVRKAKSQLRNLGQTLGVVREWDALVELLERVHAASENDGEKVALEYVLESIEQRRDRTLKKSTGQLRQAELDKLTTRLKGLCDSIIAGVIRAGADPKPQVREWLEPQIRQRLQGSAGWPMLTDPEELHDARVHIKRLRYALKWCSPALGKQGKRFGKELRAWQRLLGDHHDSFVAWQLLEAHRVRIAEAGRPALYNALCSVSSRLAQRQSEVLRELRARADKANLGELGRATWPPEAAAERRSVIGTGTADPTVKTATKPAAPSEPAPVSVADQEQAQGEDSSRH